MSRKESALSRAAWGAITIVVYLIGRLVQLALFIVGAYSSLILTYHYFGWWGFFLLGPVVAFGFLVLILLVDEFLDG